MADLCSVGAPRKVRFGPIASISLSSMFVSRLQTSIADSLLPTP